MDKITMPTKKTYPQIYVFEDRHEPGWLKVGYTEKENAEDRVREQFNTRLQLDKNPYILHHVEDAVDIDGKVFMDHDVHKVLTDKGIIKRGEFFKTDIGTVKSAIMSVKEKKDLENRHQTFGMRDEQAEAVRMTKDYFNKTKADKPEFLWNAKMRFGKTFASYQLAKAMDLKKVLVLTYKPAVESSWKEDLLSHVDFMNWQFISRREGNLSQLDKTKPFVYFASFQDILGTQDSGDVKVHNEWVHEEEWDLIIQDEYHFGAWRDNVKELLDSDNQDDILGPEDAPEEVENTIDGKYFLYLSGTPFRAINSGEFSDDQVFNWTYADEQRAKAAYEGEDNPYASLPEMNILTYQLPQKLKNVAMRGEFDEFNLSYFFRAKGEEYEAEFINEAEVQKWLDLIEGKIKNEDDITNDLVRKRENMQAQFPLSKSAGIYKELNHMLWLLPNVASCFAMEKLLKKPSNKFYKDFEIVVAAGSRGGSGADALIPLNEAIGDDPLKSKTITLTCGKLTTGVTVKPWTGIFILRSLNSPESYFQSAFRVQSPWVIHNDGEDSVIQKHKCYVFDFDPNRALSQIATYASKLDTRDVTREVKIAEFIKFLPILAYDGFAMEEIDAAGLIDISIGQTTSTLLAKGWNNALLVNVDNQTLTKMVNNEKAMEIINSIESFRRKKDDRVNKTIISSIKTIKDLKTKRKSEEGLEESEKKELSKEQRDYNKKRQLVREKLQTLATRIPLFMYLTDFREEKLTDVITKVQPELFEKTTGLTVDDFELLIELGLFNSELMNDVVYKFRNYEESSMGYSGINRHEGESVAGFDTLVNLDKERYCFPNAYHLKDSKVFRDGNKYRLNKGSLIQTEDGIEKIEEDVMFDSLNEAAQFIFNNKRAVWTEFNIEFL